MVAATSRHSNRASHHPPWLPVALLGCAALALAGGLAHRPALSVGAAVPLLIAWLPAVLRRRSAAGFAGWVAIAALLLLPAWLGHARLALMALPVVCLGTVAWLFARTLRRGAEPLVTRFVRRIEGDARLDVPGVREYTRGVTVFWVVLLTMMALLSLALALLAQPGGWLALLGVHAAWVLPGSMLVWYPEAGCWIVIAAAFVGEYAFRRWRLRNVSHLPAHRFVAQLVRRWPTLLRDGERAE